MHDRLDNSAEAGSLHDVSSARAVAADLRKYGRLRAALALYSEYGLQDDISDLARDAEAAQNYELCLQALRLIGDVRGLMEVGDYLAHFSRYWAEPFRNAAAAIRRERRARNAAPKRTRRT
jgi:uncharacterized protein YigA (DUF484 family)